YTNLIGMIYLGINGRELAWQNKRWESVEHFQQVQKKWSAWALGLTLVSALLLLAVIYWQR
ncbi:MAG: hypothetical protein HYZ45_14665, partial [Burkholderiales bacterium]|nr:hypothetical protein [Burkholderiales bacterium]